MDRWVGMGLDGVEMEMKMEILWNQTSASAPDCLVWADYSQ